MAAEILEERRMRQARWGMFSYRAPRSGLTPFGDVLAALLLLALAWFLISV